MHPWASYLVVFTASAGTMVLQLVAGRIVAPFVGVSLYTWTSIIGVMLAGISAGNYLGGRIADRWPHRATLGVLLAAGGLASLAILPLIAIAAELSAGGMGGIIDPSGNRLGGVPTEQALLLVLRIVLVTGAFFFLPSFILGMVSPVVIRLMLRDLSRTGGVAGKIYAISTFGAIVGTFATGFYLVGAMSTRLIVMSVGVVLLLAAVLLGDLLHARSAFRTVGRPRGGRRVEGAVAGAPTVFTTERGGLQGRPRPNDPASATD